MGGGGILAYLGFVGGRPDGLRGISPFMPLFSDIRLALELNKEDCLCLNFDQIQHITLQHSVRYWLLAENADEIDRALPYCLNAERIYRSVDWQQFQQNSQAKRELWQQIQQI